MVAASRLPLALGADGFNQQMQPTDALQIPTFAVANLPTGVGIKNGALAYATNGRALTGGSLAGLNTQAAASGTGVLVSYNAAAAVWQIAGTATTVSA